MLDDRRDVAKETSALACFQWGLLCYRDRRPGRAIAWLERAVWLKWENYWHQYFLAFLEDGAHLTDDALVHYNVAVALKPSSPWVRFSRARLNRSKGRWEWATDDLKLALEAFRDRPEAAQVHLELGYLYQELGDFTMVRREYDRILDSGAKPEFIGAALLNLAYLDAESGDVSAAFKRYDRILTRDPATPRPATAALSWSCQLGQAEKAEADLSILLDSGSKLENREEILAARALARLILGHADRAISDAGLAVALRPSPSYQRLCQRAILAAGRFDLLQLDRPDEIWQASPGRPAAGIRPPRRGSRLETHRRNPEASDLSCLTLPRGDPGRPG